MSLKLIFMGTPDFALPTLKAIHEAGHEILAVYTQPPRPAGRGQNERLSPVHAYAVANQITVHTPATLKAPETLQQFCDYHADAAIVAAYGLLLPQAVLNGTKLGCINVHPSLLPRWRGAAPIQRTVMAGDTETGVVIMRMNAGLDTGDMLLVERFSIPDDMNAGQLHDALSAMAGPMMVATLEGLTHKSITAVKQPEEGVTYAKKITKEECRIDWNDSAVVIHNKIRGLSPQPGAYFLHKREAVKVLQAEIMQTEAPGKPGLALDDRLTIACGQNALRLRMLQRPGKKAMQAEEWLRGYPIVANTVLD